MRIAIADTAAGPIEYAEGGSGRTVLLLHGATSCCREAVLNPPLVNAGFRLVVPSRPGYGRTPLSVGRTAADAAEAMAGLLAALGIARTIVVAVSSAGPTAVQLAARHPDLVSGLVLQSAVLGPASSPWGRPSSVERFFTGSHALRWSLLRLAVRLAPRLVAVRMLAATSTRDTSDIRARLRRSDLEAVRRFFACGAYAAGALADWDHELPDADLAAVPGSHAHRARPRRPVGALRRGRARASPHPRFAARRAGRPVAISSGSAPAPRRSPSG